MATLYFFAAREKYAARLAPGLKNRGLKKTEAWLRIGDWRGLHPGTWRYWRRWLECGRAFVAIHMASARYFEGATGDGTVEIRRIDVEALNRSGTFEHRVDI